MRKIFDFSFCFYFSSSFKKPLSHFSNSN